MKDLETEWKILFDEDKTVDLPNMQELVFHKSNPKSHPVKIIHDSKIIIHDILLYHTNPHTLIRCFTCGTTVFVKYRISFK